MGQNRTYAGPHVAVDLAIDDDAYVTVLRADISDEQAAQLGYSLDVDDAVASGRPFVVRQVAVSDELAAKLDRSSFTDADGETVDSWPKGSGRAGSPVDSPHTNPSTMPVRLQDGSELTSAQADEAAYAAQAELEQAELAAVDAGGSPIVAPQDHDADAKVDGE